MKFEVGNVNDSTMKVMEEIIKSPDFDKRSNEAFEFFKQKWPLDINIEIAFKIGFTQGFVFQHFVKEIVEEPKK